MYALDQYLVCGHRRDLLRDARQHRRPHRATGLRLRRLGTRRAV
jgi:hypothetical protein